MTGYSAYLLYTSLKLHFNSKKYDYFLNRRMVPVKMNNYEKRKDKFFFEKLGKIPDPEGFLISIFIENGTKEWIGDLFDKEHKNVYTSTIKKISSLSYVFEEDLNKLEGDFVDFFRVKKGQYPEILRMVNRKEINIETLILLNEHLKFFPVWDQKIQDPVIWPRIRHKCLKYLPFLNYDKKRIKDIIRTSLVKSRINSTEPSSKY